MSATWLWVRSELQRRWPLLVILAAVVAVGGGGTLALAAGSRRVDSVYARFADRTGEPTIVMSEPDGRLPTSVSEANRHLELLDRVRTLEGVDAVEVQAWLGATAELFANQPDSEGHVVAFSQGFSYLDPAHVPFLVLAGEPPAVDDSDGVVINEALAKQFGLSVGDSFDFLTAPSSRFSEWGSNDGAVGALDGPRLHAVVRAIGRSFTQLIDPDTPDIAVMPGMTAEMVRQGVLTCSCFVGVRVQRGHENAVRAQLEEMYRPYGLVPRPGVSSTAVIEAIRVEVTALWIAALVAAAAGLLVVAQFMSRSVTAMVPGGDGRRALGMGRGQRSLGTGLVLLPAVVLGIALGGAGAYLCSGLFPRGLALRAEPNPGRRLDLMALGLGGAGLFVALLALISAVAWRSSRVDRAQSVKRASRFARLFSTDPKRVMGMSFALDPAGDRPAPVVAISTLVGVALAAAGVVTVSTIQRSREEARSNHQIFGAPADYWFDDNGAVGAPTALAQAQQSGATAITRTIAIDDSTIAAAGASGGVTQVEPMAFEPIRGGALPTLSDGTLPRGSDEVSLGAATARALRVKVGDHVAVVDADGLERVLRVVGSVVLWGQEDSGHGFIVNTETLHALVCAGGIEMGCNIRISVWAQPADATSAAALASAGFVRIPPPANLDRLRQAGNVPWYLAGVLGALGVAGVGHALLTALRRRRRDLAVGRALGWTPAQSARVLVWQATFIGLAGGLAGAALGLMLGRLLWGRIAGGLDIVLRPATPFEVAGLTLAGVVAASVAIAVPAFLWTRRLRTALVLNAD